MPPPARPSWNQQATKAVEIEVLTPVPANEVNSQLMLRSPVAWIENVLAVVVEFPSNRQFRK
jgi:hypothetical protein